MHEPHKPAVSIQSALDRVRSLSQRRAREREGCFWIEGVRNFVQACDARARFELIVYSRILLKGDRPEMLSRRLHAGGVPRLTVSPEQFRAFSMASRASGIGAIVRLPVAPLSEVQPNLGLCHLVIEEIRSPGNLGTIIRTAEACGVGSIIMVGPRCDPFDPAVVTASKGGLFHLPLVRTGHDELARWVRSTGVRLVGLSPRSDRLWTDLPRAGPVAFVIGEERWGISDRMRTLCDVMVRLPITGRADSLNVGVATGIAMYELVRRRQATPS